MNRSIFFLAIIVFSYSCKEGTSDVIPFEKGKEETTALSLYDFEKNPTNRMDSLMSQYVPFTLRADLESLTPNQQKLIPLLIEAAKIMDDLFWKQAYGNKSKFLNSIEDSTTRAYAIINYGPWDRLNGNSPFIDGVKAKPLGANFYPH